MDGKDGQGCGWVGKKSHERCLVSTGAKENCVESCCGIIATLAPTQMLDVTCTTDWSWRHEGKDGRGCGWVETIPDDRCLLEGAKEACAICCDIEVHYHDDDGFPQPDDDNSGGADHDHSHNNTVV